MRCPSAQLMTTAQILSAEHCRYGTMGFTTVNQRGSLSSAVCQAAIRSNLGMSNCLPHLSVPYTSASEKIRLSSSPPEEQHLTAVRSTRRGEARKNFSSALSERRRVGRQCHLRYFLSLREMPTEPTRGATASKVTRASSRIRGSPKPGDPSVHAPLFSKCRLPSSSTTDT